MLGPGLTAPALNRSNIGTFERNFMDLERFEQIDKLTMFIFACPCKLKQFFLSKNEESLSNTGLCARISLIVYFP